MNNFAYFYAQKSTLFALCQRIVAKVDVVEV